MGNDVDIMRAKAYRTQAYGGFLSVPIVGLLIAFILFGPIVLTSLMKTFSFIPLHIWVVLFVVFWGYRLIR